MRWLAVLALAFVLALPISNSHAISSPDEVLADPAQEKRAEAIGSQFRCSLSSAVRESLRSKSGTTLNPQWPKRGGVCIVG